MKLIRYSDAERIAAGAGGMMLSPSGEAAARGRLVQTYRDNKTIRSRRHVGRAVADSDGHYWAKETTCN